MASVRCAGQPEPVELHQLGNNNSLLTNDSGFITSGDLPSPPSVGNGTITIVQPGTSNQTFTVNSLEQDDHALKNDNTVVTPGNGQINVNASTGLSVTGSNAKRTSQATPPGRCLSTPAIRMVVICSLAVASMRSLLFLEP